MLQLTVQMFNFFLQIFKLKIQINDLKIFSKILKNILKEVDEETLIK